MFQTDDFKELLRMQGFKNEEYIEKAHMSLLCYDGMPFPYVIDLMGMTYMFAIIKMANDGFMNMVKEEGEEGDLCVETCIANLAVAVMDSVEINKQKHKEEE